MAHHTAVLAAAGQPPPNGRTHLCCILMQALQDRFIPTRSAMDLDVAHYSLISGENDAPANSTEELLTPQKVLQCLLAAKLSFVSCFVICHPPPPPPHHFWLAVIRCCCAVAASCSAEV